jgi:hypothetical protein
MLLIPICLSECYLSVHFLQALAKYVSKMNLFFLFFIHFFHVFGK